MTRSSQPRPGINGVLSWKDAGHGRAKRRMPFAQTTLSATTQCRVRRIRVTAIHNRTRSPVEVRCPKVAFAELLIDCEEDRTLWTVLVGMLRDADR